MGEKEKAGRSGELPGLCSKQSLGRKWSGLALSELLQGCIIFFYHESAGVNLKYLRIVAFISKMQIRLQRTPFICRLSFVTISTCHTQKTQRKMKNVCHCYFLNNYIACFLLFFYFFKLFIICVCEGQYSAISQDNSYKCLCNIQFYTQMSCVTTGVTTWVILAITSCCRPECNRSAWKQSGNICPLFIRLSAL